MSNDVLHIVLKDDASDVAVIFDEDIPLAGVTLDIQLCNL